MNIRTVRRAAQDLRIALNTDEWRNRLDALNMQVIATNGPEDHYEYGIQVVLTIDGLLRLSIDVIADTADGSDLYGILSGRRGDFNKSERLATAFAVSAIREDLYREIEAAFGHKAAHSC